MKMDLLIIVALLMGILPLIFRKQVWVRAICVFVICFLCITSFFGIMAAHRIAWSNKKQETENV
ncbi:MAG: hypothetical protein KAI43_06170 [Candidatus Aureabacteria bacterium]|nr:hypothetical protein [Candidatus Auribacterota bacterium]